MTMMYSDPYITGLDRYSGIMANPVGKPGQPARETAPLSAQAPPTVMHPKLNTKPWSTSYAVKRKEPPAVRRAKIRKKMNRNKP